MDAQMRQYAQPYHALSDAYQGLPKPYPTTTEP